MACICIVVAIILCSVSGHSGDRIQAKVLIYVYGQTDYLLHIYQQQQQPGYIVDLH